MTKGPTTREDFRRAPSGRTLQPAANRRDIRRVKRNMMMGHDSQFRSVCICSESTKRVLSWHMGIREECQLVSILPIFMLLKQLHQTQT